MSSPLRISIPKANLATATRLADLGRQTFSETFATVTVPAKPRVVLAETLKTGGDDVMLVPTTDTCARAQARISVDLFISTFFGVSPFSQGKLCSLLSRVRAK